MNPDLFIAYQELVDLVITFLPDEWKAFTMNAEYDETGLGLWLNFSTSEGQNQQVTPVPTKIFPIMEKIRALAGPDLAWSEWIFDYHRSGKYDISVKYPDSPSE